MLIVLQHERHGTHIAYSEAEVADCEKQGWKRDPEMTEIMRGNPPKEAKRGPGRPKKVE